MSFPANSNYYNVFSLFLGSRGFRVLVRSRNFKHRCFTLLGVALICFAKLFGAQVLRCTAGSVFELL